MLEQRRACVPRHIRAACGDVVATERADRYRREIRDADAGRKSVVFQEYGPESCLLVPDQIHLVDGEHHVADPEQLCQVAVAARLSEHALACIDQDDGELGGGGPGDHVARVLLVAGRIGHNEFPSLRIEIAVRNVDGDALLALRGQTVDQQGEVDVLALGADPPAVGLEGRELVLEDHLAVVQEPPDQGRLAVIDAAAGDEAPHRFVLVPVQIGVDVRGRERGGAIAAGAQKYPSCFFFSMLADWSWSMARPWRSEVVVSSISRMISGSVAASLSTAPVSG